MKSLNTNNICLGSIVWMLLAAAVIFAPGISPWIATPIVLIGIIMVPGLLLIINMKVISDTISTYFLYSIGLSLSFLVLGGLAINWALPFFGIVQPLAQLPLMIFFDASICILSLRAYLFNKDFSIPIRLRLPDKTNLALGIIPPLFIALSVCGAEILNNGGSGMLTLIMLFAIALYVLILMILQHRIDTWIYMNALYCIGLSLLLMYSLRSSHILGWDINQEYQVFQATFRNLRWSMSYYPGLDYNACISITILPTIFKELIRIPSEYIFKVIFQILFAITPVMTYAFARRYLSAAYSFLAAFLLLSQTWFFEQMPALIRQEIAFIFYIAILLVLFDTRLPKRVRLVLLYIFTVSVILSHYSTAYVWLTLLLFTLILSYCTRFFIRSLRDQPKIITPGMFIVSFMILVLWQGPLTSTGGKVTNLATNNNIRNVAPALASKPINTAGATSSFSGLTSVAMSIGAGTLVALSPIIAPPEGMANVANNALLTTLYSNSNANTDQNILVAEKYAIKTFGSPAGYAIYPDANTTDYTPTAVNTDISVSPSLPRFASNMIGLLTHANRLVFIDIFTIVGIVGMYIVLRRRRANATDGTYDFILLNIGAYALILLMLFVPYLQKYYNLTRLSLQMFLVLTILAVIGGIFATNYIPRYQTTILTTMAVLIFLTLNGATDQFTGGAARITLDQPPSTLEAPYTYDTEVASAQWLATHRANNDPIQADDVAILRLQSAGNIAANNTAIFPKTIEPKSYVYLTYDNIKKMVASYQYAGNVLVYNYPLDFLNSHKDLIYNDGESRIYQ